MFFAYEQLDGRNGHEVGRQLLAKLYRDATGESLPEIACTPLGKPYFPDSPWHFSISHTKNHVFCALCRYPVGIDAEELTRKIDLRLADKILSPAERAEFDAADDKSKALLTFWVLKEAAAKLTGDGLRGYPNHTSFSLADPRVQERDGCLLAVMTEMP